MLLSVALLLICQRILAKPISELRPEDGSEYNEGLFEGDIKIGHADTKNGMVNENYLWRYRTVYYEISPDFSAEDKQMILNGIEEYHRKTCIRLIERPKGNNLPPWMNDYIYITKENTGCWSYVGRLGGPQQLNLQTPGCMIRGTIIHEILHAVGFWHEQSRPDRDHFVEINWDNIRENNRHNFNTYGWESATVLDEPYDFESVMHYGAYGFAIDTRIPTIIPKVPNVKLGQRLDFSKSDIIKLNHRYRCT